MLDAFPTSDHLVLKAARAVAIDQLPAGVAVVLVAQVAVGADGPVAAAVAAGADAESVAVAGGGSAAVAGDQIGTQLMLDGHKPVAVETRSYIGQRTALEPPSPGSPML